MSRTQEKRELGALNSRLAAYIERVRTLEVDNNRLEMQMTTIEETNTKEIISIRNMYDKELSQVGWENMFLSNRCKILIAFPLDS